MLFGLLFENFGLVFFLLSSHTGSPFSSKVASTSFFRRFVVFLEKASSRRSSSWRDGSKEVEAWTSAQEEDSRSARHTVQLSVLQSREVLRGQDGQSEEHRPHPVHHLHGGFPGSNPGQVVTSVLSFCAIAAVVRVLEFCPSDTSSNPTVCVRLILRQWRPCLIVEHQMYLCIERV